MPTPAIMITDMMIPAIAFPLPPCFFVPATIKPMTEKSNPNTLVIPKRKRPNSDNTKPAVHNPLTFGAGLLWTGC